MPASRNGSAFLNMEFHKKIRKLEEILSRSESAVIAFSGGTDSALLLYIAAKVLPKNKIVAVTADSPTYPRSELISAKRICKVLKVDHLIIKTKELSSKNFTLNPINRCYFCKRELFLKLKYIARIKRFKNVFDASNLSDKNDFRPGTKAKNELGVRSPLQEAGINKNAVRKLSKFLKLATWNKPPSVCLASRIPYGSKVSREVLQRVEKGEVLLQDEGFGFVRIRDYGRLCRIEVPKNELSNLIRKANSIVDKLKKIGYNYVTLDLEGYRSGSMNLPFARTDRLNEVMKA